MTGLGRHGGGKPVSAGAVRRLWAGGGRRSATESAAGAPQVHVAAHHTGVRREHAAHPGAGRQRLSMDTFWCLIGRDGSGRPRTADQRPVRARRERCGRWPGASRPPRDAATGARCRSRPGPAAAGGHGPVVSSARSGSVRLRYRSRAACGSSAARGFSAAGAGSSPGAERADCRGVLLVRPPAWHRAHAGGRTEQQRRQRVPVPAVGGLLGGAGVRGPVAHGQHLADRATRLGMVGAHAIEYGGRRGVGSQPVQVQARHAPRGRQRERGGVGRFPEDENRLPQPAQHALGHLGALQFGGLGDERGRPRTRRHAAQPERPGRVGVSADVLDVAGSTRRSPRPDRAPGRRRRRREAQYTRRQRTRPASAARRPRSIGSAPQDQGHRGSVYSTTSTASTALADA